MDSEEEENLFERYDLDPGATPAAITERMRALVADADDEAARARLRADWEALTLHPQRRWGWALDATPEVRAPLGTPPPRRRVARDPLSLTLGDLLPRPSVARAIGEGDDGAADGLETLPPLADDPILREES
ncbi:MAG: hypothetical protein AAF928_20450 [Myxococcota bacterium]